MQQCPKLLWSRHVEGLAVSRIGHDWRLEDGTHFSELLKSKSAASVVSGLLGRAD